MDSLQHLLEREMDRKEFLLYLGLLLLTLSGVAGVWKTLSHPDLLGVKATKIPSYGIGPYGGTKGKENS